MAEERAIWVLGDFRNYFQSRVTLQLLAKARDLSADLGGPVCAVVIGHQVEEWVGEYQAHGADRIYVMDDPRFADYLPGLVARALESLAREHRPEIILIGATNFGKELAPRTASRLGTGLSGDCVDLFIDAQGRFVQVAPAFGGNLLAEIVMPKHRPQMVTVRPGVFQEFPHDYEARAEIVRLEPPAGLSGDGVRLVKSERVGYQGQDLDNARVVVCGGRGMGSKKKFRQLHELARLMGGEVGATRPVVYSDWADEESLVGQAGKHIKPRLLLSFGISGAIQHTAGIDQPELTIAINKNPAAMMMKKADVSIKADAHQVALALIRELKARRR
jgi:electron transfer flavoprotein alpha subunit